MTPTNEQQAIIEYAKTGQSMVVNAYAGAGKTSTLMLVANALHSQGKRGIYLSFNKQNANEVKDRLPPSCTARTFHSLAYGEVMNKHKWLKAKMNVPFLSYYDFNKRYGDYIPNIKKIEGGLKAVKLFSLVKKCLDFYCRDDVKIVGEKPIIKALYSEYERKSLVDKVFNNYGDFFIDIVQDIVDDIFSPDGDIGIKYQHNLYLKYYALSNPVINADYILFDEAQDAQRLMLHILKNQTCQIIYVGDRYQQIYGWAGAVNSMQQLDGQIKTLHLTQSFRFNQNIADACMPLLTALGATMPISGAGKAGNVSDDSDKSQYKSIVCRTNAGVLANIIRLDEQGQAVYTDIDLKREIAILEDIDFLYNETGLIEFDPSNPSMPYSCPNGNVLQLSCFDELKQRAMVDVELELYLSMHHTKKINVLKKLIMIIDKDNPNNIYVTTCHKAKGLEYDSVYCEKDFTLRLVRSDKYGKIKTFNLHWYFCTSDELDERINNIVSYANKVKEFDRGFAEREWQNVIIDGKSYYYNEHPSLDIPSMIADYDNLPSKPTKIPVVIQASDEELRLIYVAMTRTRGALYSEELSPIFEYYIPVMKYLKRVVNAKKAQKIA